MSTETVPKNTEKYPEEVVDGNELNVGDNGDDKKGHDISRRRFVIGAVGAAVVIATAGYFASKKDKSNSTEEISDQPIYDPYDQEIAYRNKELFAIPEKSPIEAIMESETISGRTPETKEKIKHLLDMDFKDYCGVNDEGDRLPDEMQGPKQLLLVAAMEVFGDETIKRMRNRFVEEPTPDLDWTDIENPMTDEEFKDFEDNIKLLKSRDYAVLSPEDLSSTNAINKASQSILTNCQNLAAFLHNIAQTIVEQNALSSDETRVNDACNLASKLLAGYVLADQYSVWPNKINDYRVNIYNEVDVTVRRIWLNNIKLDKEGNTVTNYKPSASSSDPLLQPAIFWNMENAGNARPDPYNIPYSYGDYIEKEEWNKAVRLFFNKATEIKNTLPNGEKTVTHLPTENTDLCYMLYPVTIEDKTTGQTKIAYLPTALLGIMGSVEPLFTDYHHYLPLSPTLAGTADVVTDDGD